MHPSRQIRRFHNESARRLGDFERCRIEVASLYLFCYVKAFAFHAWRSSMSLRFLSVFVIMLANVFTAGCQATRTAGRKVGQAAVAIPLFVAEGLINGIFDSDETIVEQDQRERRERQWKQHWRDHPNDNPAMHEAFRDDYE
jgi:hypothetical protein